VSLGLSTSIGLVGLSGNTVTVEVDISDGLPHYNLLGLPDAALNESRDRVRAAFTNSGENWPNRKVTVSLSPAWLPKSGSSFDLAIALAILVAHGSLAQDALDSTLILGELGLDGSIRGVNGVLPALIAGHREGVKRAIIPIANIGEGGLLQSMEIVAFANLRELLIYLRTGEGRSRASDVLDERIDPLLDFEDVAGQMRARFGAEVAAAGGHHLLLIGPPGAGKTMIASRIPTILPPLTIEQSLEVTALHSVAGTLSERSPMSRMAPIVAPHHSATRVAMVGGGAHVIRPGACSLAHHGVLFIDEAPECASGILDSLRQPLESGTITIARSIGNITYPSRFLLVLAANPCPCGKFAGRGLGCSCSSVQVRRYLGKLSGPLMDRIDMRITVEPVGRADISSVTLGESSAVIAERVRSARLVARDRFEGRGFELNSAIPARELRTDFKPDRLAMNFLHDELDHERLTARGLHKVIRLSWTLADLAGRNQPTLQDVTNAYELREGGIS
jgi:magnesium chelatase family protein